MSVNLETNINLTGVEHRLDRSSHVPTWLSPQEWSLLKTAPEVPCFVSGLINGIQWYG